MMLLPRYLHSFQKEAETLLHSGAVKDVEFSGGTYQVLVIDPKTHKEEWAFLQIDNQGRLKDSFCSCKESEKAHACIHQSVAFLYLYGEHDHPLHQRFEKSLWNFLGLRSSETIGTKPKDLKTDKPGHYFSRGSRGKVLFDIQGKTAEANAHLKDIIFAERQDTEETSLKFSNLSPEEIILWEQGRPTSHLSYELSFWSDLSKWLMSMQENGEPYELTFQYSAKKLPNAVKVSFPEVVAEWAIPEASIPAMIPFLSTVNSPLPVHQLSGNDSAAKITYDKETRSFFVSTNDDQEISEKTKKPVKELDFGAWTYIPEEGFFSKTVLASISEEELHDVEKALNTHFQTIKKMIVGTTIYETPISMSYAIKFDKVWNLHLEGYLFKPGDLSTDGSHCFDSWAYLDGKGFYRIEGHYFEENNTIIPFSDVADFVSQHRIWLNSQEGFRIHLTPVEADLIYRVNDHDYLTFSRSLSFHDEKALPKDFGRWVYVQGQGFFSKVSMQTGLPVRAGASIPPDQISSFIHQNRDELHLVHNFFSTRCPVAKSVLDIALDSDGHISVIPKYELLPEYQSINVRHFDDFTYVEGEGFFELIGDKRLPERFRHEVVIEDDERAIFFDQELPKLAPFISTLDPRLKTPSKVSLIADSIESHDFAGKHSFELSLFYETDLGKISVASLLKALLAHHRFVFTEAGLLDLSEKRFGWLNLLKKDEHEESKFKLSTLELLRLNAYEEIHVPYEKDAQHQRSIRLLKEVTEFRVPDEPDTSGLKSHLREYQQLGVKWLWFLYYYGLSGLLCDDMGLGKTHQAMALLMAIVNYRKKHGFKDKRHFLVVCPTSVIYHWQEKLSEFLPELRVWTFYGANRTLDRFYNDSDILLTSYGVWRNEAELLSTFNFEVAIFDELQIAKNQTSRIYSALLKANAKMRLGLTGTPIENRLRELKALFDLVLPHYMPGEHHYRELFIRPIEREGNTERKLLLSRLIKPFVLRRKKEDVLLDLPEKIEEIAHCDLMPDQQKLYVEVLTKSRDKIIDELRDETTPLPYMHIFALLSHLKQICDHPAAYLKKAEEYKQYHSGKWELFIELLEEARESQQKVVVFSQYLAMLDIIEDYLQEQKIGYASIRGATINRGEELRRFNHDPSCEVFVASLQAAGLGVDLTAGSVVIHYDRWWNAARENQATDRVHRIGQTRGVQVFKLMTKGTIEEHIDKIIAKKGKLMEDVVSADDSQVIKKFDRNEMISLLQTLPNMKSP